MIGLYKLPLPGNGEHGSVVVLAETTISNFLPDQW